MQLIFRLICSCVPNKEKAVSLLSGRREVYTSHRLTNILTTQTDMQGMIFTQRRKEEHLLGKFNCLTRISIQANLFQNRNKSSIKARIRKLIVKLGQFDLAMSLQSDLCFYIHQGAIEFCGTEVASTSCLMSALSQGFLIIGQFTVYFGPRWNPSLPD